MGKGATIWFTGLSGSGKTTIARRIKEILNKNNLGVVILDGDEVRKTLSRDLGYSKQDRDKHITRVADVCHLLTKQGVLNIACVISPTKKIRDYARSIIPRFMEVYIKCPLEICQERDVKGHYKKAEKGELKEFVGIDIPYEEPENPDVVVETDKESVDESAIKIIKAAIKLGYVPDIIKEKD